MNSVINNPSTKQRLAATWWQIGAAVIAAGAVVVAFDTIANDPGPLWKRVIGFGLLTAAAGLVVAGLIARRRSRSVGSGMVAVGVTPGIAPIILFWFPPALAIGAFGIAVFIFAVNDANDARQRQVAGIPAG